MLLFLMGAGRGQWGNTHKTPKQTKKKPTCLYSTKALSPRFPYMEALCELYVLVYNSIHSHCRCLPESPRWLISQGKNDKAMKIISDMAKKNRKKMPSHFEVSSGFAYACKQASWQPLPSVPPSRNLSYFVLALLQDIKFEEEDGGKQSPSLIDLVRTPQMRKNTFILMYNW